MASHQLLQGLMNTFDMDQAVLMEKEKGQWRPIYAIDRTKKILQDVDGAWVSYSLLDQAVVKQGPFLYREGISGLDPTHSIKKHDLKSILILPLEGSKLRAISLAGLKDPLKFFDASDFNHAKIISKAASGLLGEMEKVEALQREKNQSKKSYKSEGLIYHSDAMASIHEKIKRIAPFNISIFIHGESGVGKEELAKEIHKLSCRKGKFVAINCANLTETLLESELFGHSKGAFTGAVQNRVGLFEDAQGGTLFLDEIGELPIDLQPKLLRAIQEKKVRPLGSNTDVTVDIRIITATLRDPKEMVSQGRFRQDLLYRIQEMCLFMPPLRTRDQDVLLLAEHFLKKYAEEFGMDVRTLDQSCQSLLLNYQWPGNIRELMNLMRGLTIFSRQPIISARDLQEFHPDLFSHGPYKTEENEVEIKENILHLSANQVPGAFSRFLGKSLKELRRDYDKEIIQGLLAQGLSQSDIASQLGISTRTVQRIVCGEESDTFSLPQ